MFGRSGWFGRSGRSGWSGWFGNTLFFSRMMQALSSIIEVAVALLIASRGSDLNYSNTNNIYRHIVIALQNENIINIE